MVWLFLGPVIAIIAAMLVLAFLARLGRRKSRSPGPAWPRLLRALGFNLSAIVHVISNPWDQRRFPYGGQDPARDYADRFRPKEDEEPSDRSDPR